MLEQIVRLLQQILALSRPTATKLVITLGTPSKGN